jgi:hypothetical protein
MRPMSGGLPRVPSIIDLPDSSAVVPLVLMTGVKVGGSSAGAAEACQRTTVAVQRVSAACGASAVPWLSDVAQHVCSSPLLPVLRFYPLLGKRRRSSQCVVDVAEVSATVSVGEAGGEKLSMELLVCGTTLRSQALGVRCLG